MKAAPPPRDIAFRTCFHTHNSAIKEFSLNVVRDQQAWDELWPMINTSREPPPGYYDLRLDEPKPPPATWAIPPSPQVGWSTSMVIVIGIGMCRTGGFDVTVRRLSIDGPVLEVYAVETRPRGGFVTQALTYPVHALITARHDGNVRLVLDAETPPH